MTRIIFWREAYFIDAFLVDCPEPHQIDWVYHNAGELFECPAGAGELADAYQHIVNATRIAPAENVRVNWRIDRARLDLFFAPRANEKIIVGRAPGNPASENLSIMIRRQNGASAKFISVFCPWPANEEPFVRRALWNQTDPLSQEIIVETINGFDKWIMPAENSTEGEECLI
jgi:hypothetical protein